MNFDAPEGSFDIEKWNVNDIKKWEEAKQKKKYIKGIHSMLLFVFFHSLSIHSLMEQQTQCTDALILAECSFFSLEPGIKKIVRNILFTMNKKMKKRTMIVSQKWVTK